VTILTTLVGASGSAGVDIADAAENGVTAVLAVSIGAVAKEYVVAVSAAPGVLSFWKVVSPRWVAVLTADATSPMVSTSDLVCARLEVFAFDAFRSAKSPLTESRVLSSSCAPATSVFEVSSLLVAPLAPASLESSEVVLTAALFRMDLTTERNTDLRCAFRSEADEAASSASAAAEPVPAEVVLVDEDSVSDEVSPLGEAPGESAYAIPGVLAMAAPTPRVTASAPTRPICLA
jgi:hypothetical protein